MVVEMESPVYLKGINMENPRTWKPLHHALSKILHHLSLEIQAKEAFKILFEPGDSFSEQDVLDCINNWRDGLKNGICGISLESALVNKFKPNGR